MSGAVNSELILLQATKQVGLTRKVRQARRHKRRSTCKSLIPLTRNGLQSRTDVFDSRPRLHVLPCNIFSTAGSERVRHLSPLHQAHGAAEDLQGDIRHDRVARTVWQPRTAVAGPWCPTCRIAYRAPLRNHGLFVPTFRIRSPCMSRSSLVSACGHPNPGQPGPDDKSGNKMIHAVRFP